MIFQLKQSRRRSGGEQIVCALEHVPEVPHASRLHHLARRRCRLALVELEPREAALRQLALPQQVTPIICRTDCLLLQLMLARGISVTTACREVSPSTAMILISSSFIFFRITVSVFFLFSFSFNTLLSLVEASVLHRLLCTDTRRQRGHTWRKFAAAMIAIVLVRVGFTDAVIVAGHPWFCPINPLRHELDELPNTLGAALRHHEIVAAAVPTQKNNTRQKQLLGVDIHLESVLQIHKVSHAEHSHVDASGGVLLPLLDALLFALRRSKLGGLVAHLVVQHALLHLLQHPRFYQRRVRYGLVAEHLHEVVQGKLRLGRRDQAHHHLVALLQLALLSTRAAELLALLLRQEHRQHHRTLSRRAHTKGPHRHRVLHQFVSASVLQAQHSDVLGRTEQGGFRHLAGISALLGQEGFVPPLQRWNH
mmetsp:Transcript_35932/g.61890  ORF Transcript_35932/g.61890 Transcript_35932/m.61890 type:complete len:423 (+) Transcript_35932:95-1363(+)